MSPLHYKVWNWLKLNVDYETGTLTATTTFIAERVSWRERNAEKVPARTTIRRVLQSLEDEGMIVAVCNGGCNSRYFTITLCNWGRYQSGKEEVVTGVVTQAMGQEERKRCDLKEVKEVQETTNTTPRTREAPIVDFTKDAVTPLSPECELLPATEEFEKAEQGLIALCRELRAKYSRITVDPNLLTRVPRALHCDPYMPQQWTPDQIRACITNWLEFGYPGRPQSLWKPIDSKDPDGELHYERCLTMGMKNKNPEKLTHEQKLDLAMGEPVLKRPWENK